MQEKVRIAIAGMGEMGMVRAVIAKGLSTYDLVCVIDPRGTFARLAGKQLGVSHYSSYEKAASAKEFDALIISTPLVSHYDLGMQAVRDGKHVFCEKPLAGDSTRAIQMHREAKVPVEVHLFFKGDHAFNMGKRTSLISVKGWPERMSDWLMDSGIIPVSEK